MTLRLNWFDHRLALVVIGCVFVAGCDDLTMSDQPRAEYAESSTFFSDGASSRPRIPGTVSRSAPLHATPPRPDMTTDLLKRGQGLFNIYCTPCHGGAGYGDGMIVQRGYPQPPSFHDERLPGIADAHLYTVITKGLGKMPAYRAETTPHDRWAIIAYIRALQRSQHATLEDVPESKRESLVEATQEME